MNDIRFAGVLLRLCRTEKRWSQEQLCKGICTVSYLSKIEQGKVCPNDDLITRLFAKMDIPWQKVSEEKAKTLCESLYELVFSYEQDAIEQTKEFGLLRQEGLAMGLNYLDYLVLRAYCCKDEELLPEFVRELLDSKQACLLHLMEKNPEEAYRIHPCALTAMELGKKCYKSRNYTQAVQILQQAYTYACQNGYARIMMFCKIYMANCSLETKEYDQMFAHSEIARRLAKSIGEWDVVRTIDYNIASAKVEAGDYEAGYLYFSQVENLTVLDAHKLAVCCEKMNRPVEALAMLGAVRDTAEGIEKDMCEIVRYRLKNKQYIKDPEYGKLLMDTFKQIRKNLPVGYARFHLPWVEEWCIANRQYRTIYEIMKEFSC